MRPGGHWKVYASKDTGMKDLGKKDKEFAVICSYMWLYASKKDGTDCWKISKKKV
jgi:hypothetical protein